MPQTPRDQELDSSVALLREGYAFGSRRFRRYGSDVFTTRLMLQRAVFARGAEAAREFYVPDRLTRRGALPVTALTLLLDRGSVAMLDGESHAHRKRMFLSFMTPESLARIGDLLEEEWRGALPRWGAAGSVVLSERLHEVFTRTVCRWAGVPLEERETPQRARELAAMFEGAGSVGPRNWRGQLLRRRTERWLGELVEAVRRGEGGVDEGTPAHVVATHRDLHGRLLAPEVAAVELINVLRPTVAVSRFVLFAALALHEHPEWRSRVAADDGDRELFVQEVRRHSPFFPLVAGRALEAFTWRDLRFEPGSWLLLDLYATNHDPRVWADPDAFRPERFRDWSGSPYDFVPQGGGDSHELTHRCAGEWLTVDLLGRAVRLLAAGMTYRLPEQDLHVDLGRMPALPASGVVLADVRSSGG